MRLHASWALASVCVFAVVCFAPPSVGAKAPATPPALVDLKDDMSRSQLADYEILSFGAPAEKNARRSFVFPADANDGIYGIDVSHHNGVVNWSSVANHGVKFVYIKVSQSDRYRDPTFLTNWKQAGEIGTLRRGGYHFLSAGVSGKIQAQTYLTLLTRAGGLKANDLAPVLDVEWDFITKDGKTVDRWASMSSDAIVQEIKDWMTTVEAATGRRPMIYTSASWWSGRLNGSLALKEYPQWIADYRVSSINAGAPKSVKQHQFNAWQFTDIGRLDGVVSKFDVNRVAGADLSILSGNAAAHST